MTLPANTSAIANTVVGVGVPGCLDDIELVGQTLALPSTTLILNANNVQDRVGLTVTGATYIFSMRPLNIVDCSSAPDAPTTPLVTVTFGINYLGDVYRDQDPVCMNASTITVTDFVVTGTPADAAIVPIATGMIWAEIDRTIAGFFHPIVNGGPYPASADPRCSNWVDLATLPTPHP